MESKNISIINNFFAAYGNRDMDALRDIVDEKVIWNFPGHHSFSGVKKGFDAVIDFFDTMSRVMGSSRVEVERLFMEENDKYVVEYQHIRTNGVDGNNLDHHWCITWKIKNGKIVEGRHFAGDQHEVDRFFHKISQQPQFNSPTH
jgi:ketosteroid isomerase-like protein